MILCISALLAIHCIILIPLGPPWRESSFPTFLEWRNPPSTQRHRLLNLRNCLARVQALWTGPRAVQDGVAPVQAHAVVQRLLPLGLVLVARVGEPAIGLEKHGGAEVFFAVPPVRGAGGGAAGTEDAFVEPVELFAVCGRLAVFEAL